MEKPIQSTEWATDEDSLKLEPTPNLKQFGWSTNDNTENGTPMKPTLNHTNGWKNIVHNWVQYLTGTTDDLLEDVEDVTTRVDILENPPETSGSFDVGRAEEFEPKPPTLLVTGERRPNPITRIGVHVSQYFDGTHQLRFGWDVHGANNITDFPFTYNTSNNDDAYAWESSLASGHGIMFSYTHYVNKLGLTMKMVCGNGHTWELKPIDNRLEVLNVDELYMNSTTRIGRSDIDERMAEYTQNPFWYERGNLESGNNRASYWDERFYAGEVTFVPRWDWPNNNWERATSYNQFNIFKDGQQVDHFVGFGDLDLANFETLNPEGIRFIAENATMKDGVVTTSRGAKIDTKKGLQRVWFRCRNYYQALWRDFYDKSDRVFDLNIPIKGGKRYEIEALNDILPNDANGRSNGYVSYYPAEFVMWSTLRPAYAYPSSYGYSYKSQTPRAYMTQWNTGKVDNNWIIRGTKCVLDSVPDSLIGQVVPDTYDSGLSPATPSDAHLYNSITYYAGTETPTSADYGSARGIFKITELDD